MEVLLKLERLELKHSDSIGLHLNAYYSDGSSNCWGHGLTLRGGKGMVTRYARDNNLIKSKDGMSAHR